MEAIQNLGFKTVAMALREDSYSIDDPEASCTGKTCNYSLAQKEDVVASETIADCDYTVKIPDVTWC